MYAGRITMELLRNNYYFLETLFNIIVTLLNKKYALFYKIPAGYIRR
jgi:hypothetical protein